jgi:hypothetical protein
MRAKHVFVGLGFADAPVKLELRSYFYSIPKYGTITVSQLYTAICKPKDASSMEFFFHGSERSGTHRPGQGLNFPGRIV